MKRRMRRALVQIHRAERGATAVVLAVCMIMLMAAGAVGLDIARLLNARQMLRAAVDAAAQAAAIDLSAAPGTAITDASAYALANYPDLGNSSYSPITTVTLYCVTAATVSGATATVDESKDTDSCNPGTKGTDWSQPGGSINPASCSATTGLCYIPCRSGYLTSKCNDTSQFVWNTVVISAAINKLPLVFGPAINIPTASTGTVTSASCRGLCGGALPPNPMDVVVMADRTYTVGASSGAVAAIQTGIQKMLTIMNPEQQFVALGTIGKSAPTGATDSKNPNCPTANYYASRDPKQTNSLNQTNPDPGADQALTTTSNPHLSSANTLPGLWVPQPFSNDYASTTVNADGTRTLNTSSALYKSITCLDADYPTLHNWNTHQAAALKAAYRYVEGNSETNVNFTSTNNLATLAPDRQTLLDQSGSSAVPKKVIILETDGQPYHEHIDTDGAIDLTTSTDVGSVRGTKAAAAVTDSWNNSTQEESCTNFLNVAKAIKQDPNVLIITIGYGNDLDESSPCDLQRGPSGTNKMYNSQMLAAVASPVNGVASKADYTDCTTAHAVAENADGDNYFCAASASDLAGIFKSALGQTLTATKFVNLAGLSN